MDEEETIRAMESFLNFSLKRDLDLFTIKREEILNELKLANTLKAIEILQKFHGGTNIDEREFLEKISKGRNEYK